MKAMPSEKKRFLNKVVFIKSANINYQEILVDGNVHFTGDQGVGKSTVLRAILFFYTADTQKLGIPRSSNKEDFAEYYFKYANSHIVYEVNSGYAQFLVWLYKEHNKLCYRFINSPFKKAFFLEETVKGSHPLTPQKVMEKVREETTCSRKILRFTEYREILYGAIKLQDKSLKTFRQYALMESSVYHNIPKTIANIFLNAKLQSDAIKTTIISSISEEEYESTGGKGYNIDLDVLRSQMNDFKQDYDDVADFDRIRKRAEHIISLYDIIHKDTEEKIFTARRLGASVKAAEKKAEELDTSIRTHTAKRDHLLQRIEALKQTHRARAKQLSGDIAVQRSNITKAREKKAYYENLGIAHILQRVEQEPSLKLELAEIEKQKRVLETEFESIEQKYQVLADQLDNEQARFSNAVHQKMNALANRLASRKQQVMEEYQHILEELDEIRDRRGDEIQQQRETLRKTIHSLEQTRQKIQSTAYFKDDLDRIEAELRDVQQNIPHKESQNQVKKAAISQFEQQQQHEEEQTETAFEHRKAGMLRQQKETQTELDAIHVKLQSFENSFYEFLNQQYPGWEETIGKVCDEQILFENGLDPEIVQPNDLLYGVRVNVEDVETQVKPLKEYEKEHTRLEKDLRQQEEELNTLIEERGKDRQRIARKYKRKIREVKKEISVLEGEVEQSRFQIERLSMERGDFQQKAERQRAENLDKITPQIVKAKSSLQEADGQLTAMRTRYQKKKQQKKQERQQALKKLEQNRQQEEQQFHTQLQTLERTYRGKKQQLEERKYAELQGRGLDTAQLARFEQRIAAVSSELAEIEGLKPTVNKYEHDREEYLDRMQEFENRKAYLENALQELETKFESDREKQQSYLQQLDKILAALQTQKDDITRQQESFQEFTAHELYAELEYHIVDFGDIHSEENLSILINRLKDVVLRIKNTDDRFRAAINAFVSPFRQDNIFHFPKQFPDNAAYHAFGEKLKEFLEEEKIERVKQDVRKMHLDLIHLIISDIDNLTSKRKEIEDTISRMNKDFERYNFVGVVQKVELKTDDSENNIVQTLLEIKTFNDENPQAFGETRLFTGAKFEDTSEKALTLLITLLKNITSESKRTEITLEDTFELKFRVVENQQDTGWQKKLTDIGSNGTDVLVKAMIYIMLLNVFKEKASKKFKDFTLHCIMDEIGMIHPKNIESLIEFANERGIWMINGSPVENNALAYRHVYDFTKNAQSITTAARLITQN